MIPAEWLFQAEKRIAEHIVRTPMTFDEKLNIHLKWENRQVTGSFKVRGAINKVLTLGSWEQEQGLVTASAGNHGQGVALAGRLIGAQVIVFASDHAVPAKVESMKKLGAEIRFVEGGYGLAEKTAIKFAIQTKSTFISAYNDGQIIAGQGTVGLEIIQDHPDTPFESWVVPVGGGGMISGIGSVLQNTKTRSRLIGVQAEASPFAYSLYHRGIQTNVLDLPTLADGLSGPVETGSITIPMMKNLVDDLIQISEEEISYAIAYAWHQYQEVIEGSGAIGLAAVLAGKIKTPAVIIISGGNIQPEVHLQICQRFAGKL